MRFNVYGSDVADNVASLIVRSGGQVTDSADVQVAIRIAEGPHITMDSVDGPLEAHLLRSIRRETGRNVQVLTVGENDSDRFCIITVPVGFTDAEQKKLELGVFRGLLFYHQAQQPKAEEVAKAEERKLMPWWKRWTVGLFMLAGIAAAQNTSVNISRVGNVPVTGGSVPVTCSNCSGGSGGGGALQVGNGSGVATNVGYGAGQLNVPMELRVALPGGSNVIGGVTQSGSWIVGQNGSWNVGLLAGTNLIGKLTISQGGNDAQVNGSGQLLVSCANCSGGGGGVQYANGAAAATPTGTVALGFDGANVRALLASAAGRMSVDVNSMPSVAVTGTFWQATQPVSAAALPLPAGAATESTLAAMNTKIPASPATDRTTAAAPSAVRLTDGTAFYKATTPSDTQPVSGTVSITANSAVNVAQMNGVTVTMGNGSAGTGVQRVAIASDNSAIAAAGQGATGSAPPAGAVQAGGIASGATGGLLAGFTVCDQFANIQQTANAQVITGVSGRRVYVCSINLVTATAQNIAVVAGTGTTCATTTVAVPGLAGGATAATGWNLSANGGIAHGGGLGAIAKTTVNGDNVCVFQSSTGQVSGGISYAIY